MNINQYLTRIDNRNSLKNFLFISSKFNQTTMTPTYNTMNPTLFSSINSSKTNKTYFQPKKEFINYTSSRSNFDKFNKKINKYNRLINNFNSDSNKVTIINNVRNNTLPISLTSNNQKKIFQFEKQNSFFFNTGMTKLIRDKEIDDRIFYQSEKINSPFKIKKEL